MPQYRALHLDLSGRVARPGEAITAETDEKAIEAAAKLMDGYDIELWQGDRCVRTIKHEK